LHIVAARYGAGNRYTDVRQLLQSQVQHDRLSLQVNNSSMGVRSNQNGARALRVRYQWAGRDYDVTVADNQRLAIPTTQQLRDGAGGTGAPPDWPSGRFVGAENAFLSIGHPDNWQVHGQGDALTITPRGGLIDDGQGNQALAYGVIVNIFEPHAMSSGGQQLTGPGYGQGSAQAFATRLERSTDQLVQELRLSNRDMRVIRYRETIRVDGATALSTYLSNDSPIGGRETDWLVTLECPDGLLFIVFTAPEPDFQRYDGAFHEMVRSVRLKR
jgi:hypothetical protein